ncbi:MAG: biotin/lipoyl-containing protein [Candidatus Rifleibacteriota bacterium]
MEVNQMRRLYEAMEANDFEELELELGKKQRLKIKLDRQFMAEEPVAVADIETEELTGPDRTFIEIRSDKVGTFSSGDKSLNNGDKIKKGEILGTVNGISFQDKIKCSVNGTVARINIQDGDVVDYGKLLFEVEID